MGMAVYAQNNVRLIRNATLKIQYAGQTLLVDPMLGKKGTEMSALGVNLNPRVHLTMPIGEVLDDVDFVLLTHTHIDHYDPAAKRLISKDTPWYVQPADYDSVAMKDHFHNTTVVKESVQVGGITIVRIAGNHGRGKLGKMMGASSGYVLKAEGQPTLYIMGDCVWNESTQKAVEEHHPAYIVVNSGGAILPPLVENRRPDYPQRNGDHADYRRLPGEHPLHSRTHGCHRPLPNHTRNFAQRSPASRHRYAAADHTE